jgi:hypothetical protein
MGLDDPLAFGRAMTDERRYGEQEVAEIFEAAASARGSDGRALSSTGGLSLAELQAIGGEVGIAPERIADAAAALDLRRGAAPRRTYLGMPVAVGRTVDLPRAPTDHEWELLVAELRETFRAHGKDGSRGGLRAWTNGNLHAYVEPTDTGHRLRLGTMKSDGAAVGRLGIAGLLAGLVMLVILLLTGELEEEVGMAVLLALMGAAALGSNALRLPRWADEREQQMEYIATRARALIRAEPEPAAIGPGS